jgi:hypothetical protein
MKSLLLVNLLIATFITVSACSKPVSQAPTDTEVADQPVTQEQFQGLLSALGGQVFTRTLPDDIPPGSMLTIGLLQPNGEINQSMGTELIPGVDAGTTVSIYYFNDIGGDAPRVCLVKKSGSLRCTFEELSQDGYSKTSMTDRNSSSGGLDAPLMRFSKTGEIPAFQPGENPPEGCVDLVLTIDPKQSAQAAAK